MFGRILDSDRADRWRARGTLWAGWVLAGAVGGAVVALSAGRLSLAAGEAAEGPAGGVAAQVVTGSLALGGAMLGIALGQWLVLRRRAPWAGSLLASVVAGGAAGGGAGLGAWAAFTEMAGDGAGVVAGAAAGLIAFGAVQGLLLRRRLPWAWPWAALSAAGLVAAVLSMGVLGALDPRGSVGIGGGVFGAAYAVVTGWLPASRAVGTGGG